MCAHMRGSLETCLSVYSVSRKNIVDEVFSSLCILAYLLPHWADPSGHVGKNAQLPSEVPHALLSAHPRLKPRSLRGTSETAPPPRLLAHRKFSLCNYGSLGKDGGPRHRKPWEPMPGALREIEYNGE